MMKPECSDDLDTPINSGIIHTGRWSRLKNDTAPTPEVFFSWAWLRLKLGSSWFSWVQLQLRLRSSLFSWQGSGSISGFCSFLSI